jgi:hypothetical protein
MGSGGGGRGVPRSTRSRLTCGWGPAHSTKRGHVRRPRTRIRLLHLRNALLSVLCDQGGRRAAGRAGTSPRTRGGRRAMQRSRSRVPSLEDRSRGQRPAAAPAGDLRRRRPGSAPAHFHNATDRHWRNRGALGKAALTILCRFAARLAAPPKKDKSSSLGRIYSGRHEARITRRRHALRRDFGVLQGTPPAPIRGFRRGILIPLRL